LFNGWCTTFTRWWSWIWICRTMMHNWNCCTISITMKINWICTNLGTITWLTFILYSLNINCFYSLFKIKRIYLLLSYPYVNTKKTNKEKELLYHNIPWIYITFLSRQAWHWLRCALSTIHIPVLAWHLHNRKQYFLFSSTKKKILPID